MEWSQHARHVAREHGIPDEWISMKLKIDKANDALYFRLDEAAVVESEEVQPGVVLDFDKENRVVGIEILGISSRVPLEKLRTLQFETI